MPIPRHLSNGGTLPSQPSPTRTRRRTRRSSRGNGIPNHRTPLERADISVSRLVENFVEEDEGEVAVGPELLDPAFDTAEDLGSFMRLSTVTTALYGTWASWVADDGD